MIILGEPKDSEQYFSIDDDRGKVLHELGLFQYIKVLKMVICIL